LKKCHLKLKELIEEVVLPDIEEELDLIFEKVAKEKNSDKFEEQLNDLHEMRDEFKSILDEIEKRTLSNDECIEIYEEITSMITEDE
jgi:uncharacterized protein (UPF0305 family)